MNLQAKIDRIKNNLDAQSYTVADGEAVRPIKMIFVILGAGLFGSEIGVFLDAI